MSTKQNSNDILDRYEKQFMCNYIVIFRCKW